LTRQPSARSATARRAAKRPLASPSKPPGCGSSPRRAHFPTLLTDYIESGSLCPTQLPARAAISLPCPSRPDYPSVSWDDAAAKPPTVLNRGLRFALSRTGRRSLRRASEHRNRLKQVAVGHPSERLAPRARMNCCPIGAFAAPPARWRDAATWLYQTWLYERRGRDSNPRTGGTGQRLSRPPHSATLPPLQVLWTGRVVLCYDPA
jgi:hypothetical protein